MSKRRERTDADTESCQLCYGLRGHERLRDALSDEAKPLLERVEQELSRLNDLFAEANDYAFMWRNYKLSREQIDWEIVDDHYVAMLGARVETYVRNGYEREATTFPVWYEGSISSAPYLPMWIIWNELELVRKEVARCKELVSAPYDWAPGGREYEKLRLKYEQFPNKVMKL